MTSPNCFPALPIELSSFIGREAELIRLAADLAEVRLLTLTGPGGSGKTRLARELARRRASEVPVLWVELADVSPGSGVLARLAQAMGAGAEATTLDALIDQLPERTLVALDNCEHVVDAVAEVAHAILLRHPTARVLATSREPLALPGERGWLVPPLAVEGGSDVPEAVRLFVERARDVQPTFELDAAQRPAVDAICRTLDGIPLAIELAAARVRLMTPAQIQARLHSALDLLSHGGRTAVPRHRTLRATLDWSHALLDVECARLLHRLAVFHGGAGLEGVEAIGAGAALDTLEALSRLVDRSWVTVRESHGEARYHLLETVRMYALERLVVSAELDLAQRLHAEFMVGLVEQARPHFTGPTRRQWVERLTPELSNLRAALEWTRSCDPMLHLRLTASLWWFWFSSRHWDEARRWLEGALELPEAQAADRRRAELLFALGALDALQGRSSEARPWLREALTIAESNEELALASYVRVYLGMSFAQALDPEAERYLEPARDWLAAHGDLYLLRLAQILLGSAYANRGDMVSALEVTAAGVATARRFGADRELGISLQALGILLFQVGDLEEARATLMESLVALERDPSIMFLARSLHFLALCAARDGDPHTAAQWLGAAGGGRASQGIAVVSIDAGASDPVVADLRRTLGATAFEAAIREGGARELGDVVAEAIAGARSAAPAPPPEAAEEARPDPESPIPAAVPDPPDLRVRLLGSFEVEVAGVPVDPDRWPYARPRELLALLLLHREGRTRDQIAAALWPDAGPTQARNSVHVTLHHLRKALERPEWVELVDGRYRIADTLRVEVDTERIEAAAGCADLDTGALRGAFELYRGDLLADGVAARWVEGWSDRVRRARREVGLRLATAHEAAGDPGAAESVFRRLLAGDELDEELHRGLLRALALRGDRAGALQHAERLERLLAEEWDSGPEESTLALVQEIRAGRLGPRPVAGATG